MACDAAESAASGIHLRCGRISRLRLTGACPCSAVGMHKSVESHRGARPACGLNMFPVLARTLKLFSMHTHTHLLAKHKLSHTRKLDHTCRGTHKLSDAYRNRSMHTNTHTHTQKHVYFESRPHDGPTCERYTKHMYPEVPEVPRGTPKYHRVPRGTREVPRGTPGYPGGWQCEA
jgi:hypothetical protein